MAITALPTPPSRSNPSTFSTLADAFLNALPTFGTEANALATQMNTNLLSSLLSVTSSSTSSLTIGTGTQTLNVGTNSGYVAGMTVKITSTASTTNYMVGTVTSYNTGTGVLVVNVSSIGGSGTATSWSISFTSVTAPLPMGSIIAYRDVGSTFTDASGSTYLKTGVIAPTATYPLAPTTVISDGSTWVSRTGVSMNTSRYAYGNSICVATDRGTAGTVYATSTDGGTTWSSATLPVSGLWIPCFGNGTFLLVDRTGSATIFLTSTTGLTGSWTQRTVTANANSYKSIIYGASGFLIGSGDTNGLLTTDGITYSIVTLPLLGLENLAFGNGFYLACATSGTTVYKSASPGAAGGTAWISTTVPTLGADANYGITYGNGVFLVAKPNSNLITTDGVVFTTVGAPLITGSNTFNYVYGNGTFYAQITTASSTGYTSADNGQTWVSRTLPSSAAWRNPGWAGTGFTNQVASTTTATNSVTGGTYTDTARALFADSPNTTRPLYMRVA